jgi:hypothetical protein
MGPQSCRNRQVANVVCWFLWQVKQASCSSQVIKIGFPTTPLANALDLIAKANIVDDKGFLQWILSTEDEVLNGVRLLSTLIQMT